MIKQQPSRPLCISCQTSLAKSNGISKHGFIKWHKYCVDCAKIAYNPRFKYLAHKQQVCGKCGFIAQDKCQLDVVTINGKESTMCANCHRLHSKETKKKSILSITVDADVRI